MDDRSSKAVPSPPIRKRRRKKPVEGGLGSLLLYFIVLCAGVGLAIGTVIDLAQIWDDLRLRVTGTLATESYCRIGHVAQEGVYDGITAHYTTQNGVKYREELASFSFFGPNQEKPCVVRYDPASPTHVSTSWGLQIIFGRTLLAILSLFFSAAIVLSCGEFFVLGVGSRFGWVRPPSDESLEPVRGLATGPALGSTLQHSPRVQTRKPRGVPLRDKVIELSRAVHKLADVLASYGGSDASYAKVLGSQIDILAREYDDAIFVTHDRECAAAVIATIVEEIGDVPVTYKRPKRHLGLRYAMARWKFRRLNTIFRESRYEGDAI